MTTLAESFQRHAIPLLASLILAFATSFAQAALFDEPYFVDPGFAGGSFTDDAFASNLTDPNKSFVGKKVVRLNGNIVVAALVKHPTGNQSNNRWNLGLVRYNSTGTQRLTWSNPGASYGHFSNQYVVYPNNTAASISEVVDMLTFNQKIYVLVNDQLFAGSATTVSRILVFGADGAFISSTSPFSATTSTSGDTSNIGGGLASYTDLAASQRNIVVAATRFPPGNGGRGRPVFRRFQLAANGDLATSPGAVDLSTTACGITGSECQVRAIKANSLFSPRFYVAYAYRPSTSTLNWDVVVSRVDVNGVRDPAWNTDNSSGNISDGGNFRDWPVGLEVRTPPSSGVFRDEIYVVAESSRSCQIGVGVLRFNHDGSVVAARLFGGDTSMGQECVSNSRRFDIPRAIVANATGTGTTRARLAIVGYTGISLVVGPPTNATLTVLDANLATRDSRDFLFPLDSANRFGERFPALNAVVSDGTGTFTAVGSLTYPSYSDSSPDLRGKSTVTAVRFAPDRIFDDQFE